MKVVMWLDVVGELAIFAAALLFRPHTPAWFAGILLAAIGFPLWILARVQLGSAFSPRAVARCLVTTGLYARFSHPIYLFAGLASIGTFLALQVWWLFAVNMAFLPIQLLRARREEKVLRAAFGDEYDRYRKTTWL